VDFPVGEAYRIGTGVQWKVAEAIELGAAYEFMWGGDVPVDQERGPLTGRVTGEYEDMAFHFFALNLSWRL
jgi:long-chain fatty acid transport protein